MVFLALAWGLIAASAVFIGAAIGWFARPSQRVLAGVMAFGSGVLLSLVAYEIVRDAFDDGGLLPTVIGYVLGAILFTLGLTWLNRAGARHRKRSTIPPYASDAGGVVALATILDSVPESLIIGFNFYNGEAVALATVAAVFVSNIPEGISSTARMRMAGRSFSFVVGLWTAVAVTAAVSTLAGYLLLNSVSDQTVALMQAIGGGALFVLIIDTMVPEAFADTHEAAGLIAAAGFLTGFMLAVGLG